MEKKKKTLLLGLTTTFVLSLIKATYEKQMEYINVTWKWKEREGKVDQMQGKYLILIWSLEFSLLLRKI